MPQEDISFLRNVPIFSELEDKDLQKVVKLGTRQKYKKGNIVVLEQESGAALFVIIAGKVKVVRMDEDGREVILSMFGPGEFFGTRQSGFEEMKFATFTDIRQVEELSCQGDGVGYRHLGAGRQILSCPKGG